MRGNGLFTSLFDTLEPLPVKDLRKGRNADHDTRRNEALIARYYYLGRYTDKRYRAIMQQLSDEFYLSERRIQDIMQQQSGILRQLRQLQPVAQWFVRQYPHLVWPAPQPCAHPHPPKGG